MFGIDADVVHFKISMEILRNNKAAVIEIKI
jgi:hypothetical protein